MNEFEFLERLRRQTDSRHHSTRLITGIGDDASETITGVVIDSIVLGEVDSGAAVQRSGARAGDQIFVTGTLGGAAAGLKLIQMGARSEPPAIAGGPIQNFDDQSIQSLILRQLRPAPRVGWA